MVKLDDYTTWDRAKFEALPLREQWDKEMTIQSLVILPGTEVHNSGFVCMDFVAIQGGIPTCRLAGGSDVLHLDGIGGYGYRWLDQGGVPMLVRPKGWCFDCLPGSGLLRLFCDRDPLIVGSALSSFEVYAIKKKDNVLL